MVDKQVKTVFLALDTSPVDDFVCLVEFSKLLKEDVVNDFTF
jgi:hypothetical protein